MSNIIGMNPSGEKGGILYQCHPIGIQNEVLKIIQGDMRVRTWQDNENTTHTVQATLGKVVYDKNNVPNRPWFLLAYESGKRIED